MDLGSAIIGAILIAIFVVPVILINKNSKKRDNKALQSLINIATEHNCIISKHEICSDFVIGIDEIKNFVFFFKQKNENAISQFVDLSEIRISQALKSTRAVKSKNENVTIIEKVKLSFIPKNKAKTEIKFDLYDEDNVQPNGELQLVDKWSKLINDRLANKN
jgi:hypothetical protein